MGQQIGREGAKKTAADFLRKNAPHLVPRKVCDYSEVTWRKPQIYGAPQVDWETVWVVYCRSADASAPGVIKNSTIVLVSKEGGEVVYFGSAMDEG